ncbi:F-box domain, Leucine-rich repeat domain, L domain-like protein [Artemisia annua]|uniref:F-box domain, Leucine-rich repeat domain, L domain-like protein n=1 Tax=Artemisia annua TaxID=35608 RepID=A0A2U1PZA8_ARTAN|nr:F-box domain, Leucine-rich repeat domain, L domain-like protein [Artemisia annua]
MQVPVESGPWARELHQMPIAFPCLKTLTLYWISFSNASMVHCAFYMIWASRNLQTLNITAAYNGAFPPLSFPSKLDTSKMKKLLQLRSMVFGSLCSGNEVYLITWILGCSPLLKKIDIYPPPSRVFGGENGKLMFATELLKLHRASPVAEVDIHWS